jgi:hypothetical protein
VREQSRLVTSLPSDKAELDVRIRVANASARLIEDEAIQFIFQEMEDNLYRAFSSVPTPEQGEGIWREVKVVKALKENLEWYANQRETLAKKGRGR